MTYATRSGASWLTVVCTDEDDAVHLARTGDARALCGNAVDQERPAKSYRVHGCAPCLEVAQAVGYYSALNGEFTWVDLRALKPGRHE